MRPLPLFLLALAPLAAAVPAAAPAGVGTRSPVLCTGAIQHPIEARVVALDPIRRGATVRFEVTAVARGDARAVAARIVRGRGVEVVGPERAALLRRGGGGGEERTAEFRAVVPRSGHRAVVQFVVEGEGPAGPLTRGAAYNLLPDGPAETLRPATTGSGEGVLEAPARRIDR
jgi:hypothetical protein